MKRVLINLFAALGLAAGVGAAAYLDERDRRQHWRSNQGRSKYRPNREDRVPRGRSLDAIETRRAWREGHDVDR